MKRELAQVGGVMGDWEPDDEWLLLRGGFDGLKQNAAETFEHLWAW
jgi:hypothetical protein